MSVAELFHIGAALLSTTIDAVTGTVLAQLGSVTEEYVFSDDAEMYGNLGLASRASKPTAGHSAAEVIAIRGDRDIVIAARDTRSQAIYGNLKEGETCLFGPGEFGTAMGRVIIKQTGAVTLYTTDDNTDTGKAVYMTLAPDGLTFVAPWGSMVFDATGFHLKTNAGPRLDMGGLSIPVPGADSIVNAIAGYATLSAPIVKCAGNLVFLGNGPNYQAAVITPASLPTLPPAPLTLKGGPAPTGGNEATVVKISLT